MYRALGGCPDAVSSNLFFSPLSISFALLLASAGTKWTTQDQIDHQKMKNLEIHNFKKIHAYAHLLEQKKFFHTVDQLSLIELACASLSRFSIFSICLTLPNPADENRSIVPLNDPVSLITSSSLVYRNSTVVLNQTLKYCACTEYNTQL